MAGIIFLEKSKIDISVTSAITFTVTDATATDTGESIADYLRDRRNWSGWTTTGSNDAAGTILEVEFAEAQIDKIMLINHNLKSFTVKYWDGSAYQDFSTPISETTNTEDTNYYSFNSISTSKIKLTINGTMVANDDKFLSQLIITEAIGQFSNHWVIAKPEHDKNKKTVKAISGRVKVFRNEGAFSCELISDNVIETNDLTIVESLFDYYDGFLVWLCGNDTTQFRTQRVGYRKRDLYHVVTANSYEPEWANGFYNQGTNIKIKLIESI